MEANFWHQRWQGNEIGFHQSNINPFLTQFWPKLNIQAGTAVLVPLCGKSRDMLWLLDQGLKVTGIELSDLALEAFVEENQLPMTSQQKGSFKCWNLDNLELLAGDFFQYQADSNLAAIKAVYDRAALIALPESMRRKYVQHIADLLPSGGDVLLVSMEYDQKLMAGPPFSVQEAEVLALYGDQFDIELLQRVDVLEENLRFKQRGLSSLYEVAYRLTRR